ncbi:hypothetical protein [Cohnella fermenti]|uniref:Uncharacterized protein n=1 Tax=Cohnella fermenti TaxID=2565925 RepID=A0A4S4C777_9BACL|nr:hypothetical protein [Cohnella fermenti]THF83731.1 hypothetical protein E6C55_03310 [Cohnella fermenti]
MEKNRFEDHIIDPATGHKELAGNEEAIKHSVENPYLVVQSNKIPNRYLYYGKSSESTMPWLTIKSVVDHSDENFGFIVTSMFQKKITPEKEGAVIYDKKKAIDSV